MKSRVEGCCGQGTKVCALEGSSVELRCSSSHRWYTVKKNGSVLVQHELAADGSHVTYNLTEENERTVTIKELRESDAAFYCCTGNQKLCWQNAVQLNVSGTENSGPADQTKTR